MVERTDSETLPASRAGSRYGHYLPRRLLGRRMAITLYALALVTVVLTVVAGCRSSQPSAPPFGPAQVELPRSRPSWAIHNPQVRQVELPFSGLNSPSGVAVDTAGNVYIADNLNNRVLKLGSGSATQVELPFTGLKGPSGLAVDTAGNVYVTDGLSSVFELPAGSTKQVKLPFADIAGLNSPEGVAVDRAGNVYITDYYTKRVLKLPAASSTPVELPFTGMTAPWGVAVGSGGNIYVTNAEMTTNASNNGVFHLPAGSNTPVKLPFTGLKRPVAVAVDAAGNVYAADYYANRVLKLPSG